MNDKNSDIKHLCDALQDFFRIFTSRKWTTRLGPSNGHVLGRAEINYRSIIDEQSSLNILRCSLSIDYLLFLYDEVKCLLRRNFAFNLSGAYDNKTLPLGNAIPLLRSPLLP
uniref:Uncharacterized protein n=1 Tax=Parascaris univalens TaxID=6257 RepID=A0A915AAZ8_PARUN